VVFTHKIDFRQLGGAHMDLEEAYGKKVDLLVSPPEDFVEKIQKYWIPITLSEAVGLSHITGLSQP